MAVDVMVVTARSSISTTDAAQAGDRRSPMVGLAVTVMRTSLMVALASLAILVLLPAAIAAQAAIGV
jgi:hypothetical protein